MKPLKTPSVADPGFARGEGGNPLCEGAKLLFGQKFPQNCMKIKEFGPRGGRIPGAPPRSANALDINTPQKCQKCQICVICENVF